jgi:glycosyltransferase involved in cell wall biosynthesis
MRRLGDCLHAKEYDVIYIYRECLPFGPPLCEWLIVRSGRPIVYDIDDAIHLPDPRGSLGRWLIERLKWHSKVPWIVRHSAHVIVGNDYLKDYAAPLTSQVTVLPTPENPHRFNGTSGRPSQPGHALTIGWIGTHSTARYLERLKPVFQELARRHPFELRVIGAGSPVVMPGVRVANQPWRLEHEAGDVERFDIGVYPLSDAEFDRGKACYKAILYMAAGVPMVASNHGANQRIIQHGVNGLLASSDREWVEHLARLMEDPSLRARLAEEGRKTVSARYSVEASAPTLIRILTHASSRRNSHEAKAA